MRAAQPTHENTTPNMAKIDPYDQKCANTENARILKLNASICITLHTEFKSEHHTHLAWATKLCNHAKSRILYDLPKIGLMSRPVLPSNFFQWIFWSTGSSPTHPGHFELASNKISCNLNGWLRSYVQKTDQNLEIVASHFDVNWPVVVIIARVRNVELL